jgi:hypothetical protein
MLGCFQHDLPDHVRDTARRDDAVWRVGAGYHALAGRCLRPCGVREGNVRLTISGCDSSGQCRSPN